MLGAKMTENDIEMLQGGSDGNITQRTEFGH
jgi:hypothetical protein